ncbi:hypothetical protein PAMP_021432 [Pampus punctatissimus]
MNNRILNADKWTCWFKKKVIAVNVAAAAAPERSSIGQATVFNYRLIEALEEKESSEQEGSEAAEIIGRRKKRADLKKKQLRGGRKMNGQERKGEG